MTELVGDHSVELGEGHSRKGGGGHRKRLFEAKLGSDGAGTELGGGSDGVVTNRAGFEHGGDEPELIHGVDGPELSHSDAKSEPLRGVDESELGGGSDGVETSRATFDQGGGGVEPKLAELGDDGVETALEVEGDHSEAAVVVDGAEARLVEAKHGANGAETRLDDGGGHSTRVVATKLGVVRGELQLATRTRPVLSRESCFSPKLSKLCRRSWRTRPLAARPSSVLWRREGCSTS